MTIGKNITPFDVSQVNLVLRAIVGETPAGTRYEDHRGNTKGGANCRYVAPDGTALCLVGKLAERLGIPLPSFGEAVNSYGIQADNNYLRNYFTQAANTRLETVQLRQDNGETWRRAIR